MHFISLHIAFLSARKSCDYYVTSNLLCSYPVVFSALREWLSKPPSEIVYLRTMVQTLGLLEEGIETDMQTSSMSLLDVVYFAYWSACSAHNWTVSPWFQQQKSVSEIYEIWTRLCLASNSLYMHCAGVLVEQGTVIRDFFPCGSCLTRKCERNYCEFTNENKI